MGYGFKLKVWGEYACFTRPEMKAERVSYDVITPSAARAIYEAIYWKPSIKWVIDRITVLNKIKFTSIRRNEIKSKIGESKVNSAINGELVDLVQYVDKERQQRASLVLKDVSYIIDAHFDLIDRRGEDDTEEKHYNVFLRRARNGQCFHTPYLGCREFPANFELIEDLNLVSVSSNFGEVDLGWVLKDIEFSEQKHVGIYNKIEPKFFRVTMVNGVIDVN